MDYDKLTKDLAEARTVAMKAIEGVEDGGSANLDHLLFIIGRNSVIQRRSKKLTEAVEAAGCRIDNHTYRGGCCFWLNISTGQAARRTIAFEAAQAFLTARGWPVSMQYVLD